MAKTYTDLIADMTSWLWRDDAHLTGQIPTLIKLAHDRANRNLRLTSMMVRARATGNNTRFLSLPGSGSEPAYLDMRSLRIKSENYPGDQLIQVSPEGLKVRTDTAATNRASRYCIHREIEFDTVVDDGTQIEMVYYSPFLEIDADNPTNWLTENAYDVYLYGALAEAEPFLRNDERIKVWVDRWSVAIGELRTAEHRARSNRSEIRQMLDPQEWAP